MAEQEDEPLDPKVEAIRRKMVRLLIVSGGIMMIGLMTVLVAIVYRINQSGERYAANAVTEATITLPTGSVIEQTALDGDRMMLTLRLADGSREIHLIKADGTVAARYQLR